ncbi:hypothetical protein D9613_012764 [Agrocybe pediades]|uniref:Uncharacterized protein n=1 Tax=Agrocybe pediades TaxID=84607 RepID=A0A8H4VIT5_9AGAR|nr:hypothetical protein D9613_012764 [Agrocybe pediades]
MKFSLFATLLPILATCLIDAVVAAPITGLEANVNIQRNNEALTAELLRRADLRANTLDARGIVSMASKIFKKKQPTAAELAEAERKKKEKERRKQFRQGHKQYVATGKQIAKEAKKEAKANGVPYEVKVNYKGPGYAQYGAKAKQLAQKGWTRNLQQYKFADVE